MYTLGLATDILTPKKATIFQTVVGCDGMIANTSPLVTYSRTHLKLRLGTSAPIRFQELGFLLAFRVNPEGACEEGHAVAGTTDFPVVGGGQIAGTGWNIIGKRRGIAKRIPFVGFEDAYSPSVRLGLACGVEKCYCETDALIALGCG